jgi:hypothetical protein
VAQSRYASTVKLKDNRITCNEDSVTWRIERDGIAELLHHTKGQVTATEPKRIETNRCVNVNVVDCREHLIDQLMAPLQASWSISAQLTLRHSLSQLAGRLLVEPMSIADMAV